MDAELSGVKARTGGAALFVSGLITRYGAVTALDGIDLEVAAGELLTILGPSGSGKTTLLKTVAGFAAADAGSIVLGGRDISDLPPARREIGMVFQNYALFPHLTVAANIAFPLRMRRIARGEIARRVAAALALVSLEGLGARYPAQLSGGQQQRVALARAIVFEPELLLLDEPFGALDRKLRESMQLEVKRLQRRLGLTTVFITHDQEEALLLSDRIAVMRAGKILQIAPPRRLYEAPSDPFVADFVGEATLWRARIEALAGGKAAVRVGPSLVLAARERDGCRRGDDVLVLVRPELPRLAEASESTENRVCGTISEAIYLGGSVRYRVALPDGLDMLLRWPAQRERPVAAVGDPIELVWAADDTHLIPAPQ